MNTDAKYALCTSQAFSTDAISENIRDLGVTGRRYGAGEPMCIAIHVEVAADTTTGDETYEFQVRTDDDVAFGSPTTLSTTAIAAAALTAGSKHILMLSPAWTFERYLAIYFNGGGTTPTITVSAWVMPVAAVEAWQANATAGGFTN